MEAIRHSRVTAVTRRSRVTAATRHSKVTHPIKAINSPPTAELQTRTLQDRCRPDIRRLDRVPLAKVPPGKGHLLGRDP